MTNRFSLVFLVLVLAVGGALVWLLGDGDMQERRPADLDLARPTARPTARSEGPPLGTSDTEPEPAPAPEAAPVISTRAETASAYEEELAAGRWVEGRVLLPVDTPADEACHVIASSGVEFEHGEDHRVPVDEDGRFRVAFAPGTKSGRLQLDARYLYLDRDFELTSTALDRGDEVLLEPAVGGRIAGRVVLPEGHTGPIEARLNCWESGRGGRRREGKITDELAYSLNALAGQRSYRVSLDAPEYRQLYREAVAVVEGETTVVDLTLESGLVATGIVVDEEGGPVEEVIVELWMAQGNRRTVRRSEPSAADGSFRIAGITPSDASVRIQHAGFEPHKQGVEELSEADVADLRIELVRGARITGRVEWTDGTPVAGAPVSYSTTLRQGWSVSSRNHEVLTDEDGRFEILGLDDEPRRISATSPRPPEPEEGEEPVEEVETEPVLRAAQNDVAPGTTDVVLVLGSGASITGNARDTNGTPLTEFKVTVTRLEDQGTWKRRDRELMESVESRDGSFELTGIPDGHYELTAIAEGFGESAPVERVLPAETDPVALVLGRTAALSGIVLGPDGLAAQDAFITIQRPSRHGFWQRDPELHAKDDGRFRIEPIAPGEIQVSARGGGFAPSSTTTLELVPGEETSGVTLQLLIGATLTGEVYALDGSPDADREVQLWSWEADQNATARTDENGRFRIESLIPGSGQVSVPPSPEDRAALLGDDAGGQSSEALNRQSEVQLESGETTHVVLAFGDLELVVLEGQILLGGEPLANALINCWSRDGGEASYPSDTTDDEGRYTLTLPHPGAYSINLHDQTRGTGYRIDTDVPATTRHRVDLDIPVGSIEGRVRGPGGEPVAGLNIRVQGTNKDGGATAWGNVRTDSDGRYEATSLAVNTYTVSVTEGGNSWPPDLNTVPRYANASQAGVVVDAGALVRGIDFDLGPAGGVAGHVLADGEPVRWAWVRIEDASGKTVASSGADEAGRFRIVGVPPGQVTVLAQADRQAAPKVTLEVRQGEVEEVELSLRPIGSVLVALIGPDGTHMEGQVTVLDGEVWGTKFTDERLYRLHGLPEGEYTLRAVVGEDQREQRVQVPAGEETRVDLRFE